MKLLLSALIIATFSLTFTGCASKKPATAEQTNTIPAVIDQPENNGLTFDLNADSDNGKTGPIKSIYFEYESHTLTAESKKTLEANAEIMKTVKTLEVQVEGHCDERGGVQFNLALGDRRAKSVRDFLVALGVDARRLSTISFGKERPISFGHEDSSWSKNRRANFVVTAK